MSTNARRILLGVVAAVAVIGGLFAIAAGPGSDREVSNLGTDQFDTLRPEKVARDAAEGPLFFPDPIRTTPCTALALRALPATRSPGALALLQWESSALQPQPMVL